MYLNVVAGQKREVVGTITPRVGMLTSAGTITRITSRTIYFENGSRRRNLERVTVRHTEAQKFGYPFADGCVRVKQHFIRRGTQSIAA